LLTLYFVGRAEIAVSRQRFADTAMADRPAAGAARTGMT